MTMETSEIYDEAVELRELLNKIPDWKNRMCAQFLICVRISNREIKHGLGIRSFLGDLINPLQPISRMRLLHLTDCLKERGKHEFSGTVERYALRAFIMSVILGQEFANADAIQFINGLREGVDTE